MDATLLRSSKCILISILVLDRQPWVVAYSMASIAQEAAEAVSEVRLSGRPAIALARVDAELLSLMKVSTPYSLACEHQEMLRTYVYMRRGLLNRSHLVVVSSDWDF